MNTVWPPVGCLLPSLYQQLRREVASIHNTCTKLVTRKLPVLTSSRRQRTWMRTAISRTTPESATCARRQAADQQQQAAAAKLQLIVAGGYQLVTGIAYLDANDDIQNNARVRHERAQQQRPSRAQRLARLCPPRTKLPTRRIATRTRNRDKRRPRSSQRTQLQAHFQPRIVAVS